MEKYEVIPDEENILNTINADLLGRNYKLVNLIKLLDSINENFLLSIDGKWGSGKTFFVKQLMYICNNFQKIDILKVNKDKDKIEEFSKKYITFYYNAWENDNHIEPLESLIYNILNEYPKYKSDIENPKDLFNSVKPILKNLIEKMTIGVITKECFEQLKSFDDLAENIVTLEEKQKALNKLFDTIIGKDNRLLLIIDELDRCKLDYAVKMLETLKHFYNNNKLTIIVVTNNKELSNTIRQFYGYDFDGYSYLNKIYDTTISLEIDNLENYLKNHCNILSQTHLPENMSFLLFKYLNFSYRECNKYMTMYRIVEPYMNYKNPFGGNEYFFEANMIVPMVLALKIKDIDEYNLFITGKSEKFIKDFLNSLDSLEKSIEYKQWFDEILEVKDNDVLETIFVDKYKKMFAKKSEYRDFPYLEVISMLGNSIKY